MPSVSVVIVTKNEEANIGRCLESVKWADETIVVDSGSTDRTLEICKGFSCRLIHNDWPGDGEQKNYGISLASGEWILVVDADEEVSSELQNEISDVIRSNSPNEGYYMPRSNYFLGKWMRHGGWYPDRQLRLFKRESGSFVPAFLHAHVKFPNKVSVGVLKSPLVHYTYQALGDFISKAETLTNREAEIMVAQNRVPKRLVLAILNAFPVKFAEVYLYKGGWKDGAHGLIAATLMSSRVLLRYVKVWEILRLAGRN